MLDYIDWNWPKDRLIQVRQEHTGTICVFCSWNILPNENIEYNTSRDIRIYMKSRSRQPRPTGYENGFGLQYSLFYPWLQANFRCQKVEITGTNNLPPFSYIYYHIPILYSYPEDGGGRFIQIVGNNLQVVAIIKIRTAIDTHLKFLNFIQYLDIFPSFL